MGFIESIVGIILRTISVNWQNTYFEQVCDLFEEFSTFMKNGIDEERVYESQNSKPFHEQTESHLDIAERLSKLQDIAPAMESLHKFYDLSSAELGVFAESVGSSFVGFSSVGPNPQRRHSLAMLSMATVWMRAGNSTQAMCAVEEALKQAQRKGDHVSVFQSTLLMQHILVISNGGNVSVLRSVATTLQQLIDRCSDPELKLRTCATQARLLLSKVKVQSSLIIFHQGSESNCSERRTSSSGGSTPQEIWQNLLLVHLGENSSQNGPLTTDELGTIPLQASIISADFWCKLGIYEMAEFESRRGIRRYLFNPMRAGREDFMYACIQCATLKATLGHDNAILTLFFGQHDKAAAILSYDQAALLLQHAKDMVKLDPIEQLHKKYKTALLSTKLWRAIASDNFETALQLTVTLIGRIWSKS